MQDSTGINSCLLMTMSWVLLFGTKEPPLIQYHSPTAQSLSKFLTTVFQALHNQVPAMFLSWLLLPKLPDTSWVGHPQVSLCLSPATAFITSMGTTITKNWEGRQWPTSALPYPNLISQWCFTLWNYLFLLLPLFLPSTVQTAILTELDLINVEKTRLNNV